MNKSNSKPKPQGSFIIIKEDRIVKSAVKRYTPFGNKLNVHFSTSISKPQFKTYEFKTSNALKRVVDYLDSIYL